MEYTSVNIQGNIISSEILDKIRNEDIKYQEPEAFGLAKTASIRDEIGMAWSVLRSHWGTYKKRLDALPKRDTGTSLTREKWILPFLTELGYELSYERRDIIVNDKGYGISHQAINRDNFPVLVMGYNDDLDKRRESGGPKQSPHSLVQEYLNHTEHLFALITNGKHLRLLRDATRLVRLSYLEFDLEKIMEEELYADFALLYRTLHVSRMPEQNTAGEEAIIEYYHQESLASGSRIRERLSTAVEKSIRTLANGFLRHPLNESIRTQFEEKRINANEYYLYLLRLIYRVLFLIVIEERKLIYPDKRDPELNRFRDIYFNYYSVERIRKLAEQKAWVDGEKYDLWQGLITTFQLFENEHYGKKLGIAPLGSGLFAPNAIGPLHDLMISNRDFLEVIRNLTTFFDDQKQLVRVNYSDLDVEEFGSVYEGLLEYDPSVELVAGQWQFNFVEGEGRSSSGSHYTPEELVKPLIKHSLDYIISDKLNEDDPEKSLLSIKVCDVACGSGHILLSAARRIATELAGYREGAEQPSPKYYRTAIRDVIKSCINGVDLNPLAVELCKVALWLEAHNPGEPLNFLDHRIKCGNAIVGLAHLEELNNGIPSEAFKTLPDDDKDIASELRRQNDKERKARRSQDQLSAILQKIANENVQPMVDRLQALNELPEHTPEEIEQKSNDYQQLMQSKSWWRLKQLADIQVAQFFIEKNKGSDFITDGKYFQYLIGEQAIQTEASALALGKATEKRFFHWFLEFPEVMSNGGFDCILGNPPFLGNRKLSGTYGSNFLEFVKYAYSPIGSVDLVTYFFRRNFDLIRSTGFISLISTNTVAQGDARAGGLGVIAKQGGRINHAVKSMKWPGQAAVEVSLITIHNGLWKRNFVLDNKVVKQISTYLDSQDLFESPQALKRNENKSFIGSYVLGTGFIISEQEAKALINKDQKNKDVIFPYLNGQDLNNKADQTASRWIINFFDWTKDKAKEYPDCYNIIENKVKPERTRWKKDKDGNDIEGTFALRKPLPQKWWIYADKRPLLYSKIKYLNRVLVVAQVSKTVVFEFTSPDQVLDSKLVVFAFEESSDFAIMQSTIHSIWAWKYCTTMKADLSYTPVAIFLPFPRPESNFNLKKIGDEYLVNRISLTRMMNLGLTKTYNLFHQQFLSSVDIEKQSKQPREVCEQAHQDIIKLRELHKEMDEAVLEAYGWGDIDLKHDFYEVDYLPENDCIRYTIHPEARKEVLKRLLLLNHERWEEEARQGLHDKKTVEKFYSEKGKPIPSEVSKHFEGGKKKKIKLPLPMAAEDQPKYRTKKKVAPNQVGMFAHEEPVNRNREVTINSRVEVKNLTQDKTFHFVIVTDDKSAQQVIGHQPIKVTSQLALSMVNRKARYKFKLGDNEYEILNVE